MAYRSATFWDKVASKYAAIPIRNPAAYEATLDQVRTLVSPSDIVLELGCGTGTTAVALAPSVATLMATDVSSAMLDIARRKAAEQNIPNLEFALSDAFDAPKGPFDVVLAFNLLHLVEDLNGVLSDIATRTKPGGVFVSKTFCMPEQRNVIWFFIHAGLPVMQAIGKAPFFAKLTKEELVGAITRVGFVVEEIQKAPGTDPRWTIIARKAI